jgi:dTDP-4-dehydrorhamnose 3,5-epimerase
VVRVVTSAGSIAGVCVTPLRCIADERGAVLHMLRADAPEFVGFGECYFSEITPGSVKAWKRHRRQTQNLAVPSGRVRFVIWDVRDDSASFGRLEMLELGRPDAYVRLRIPPRVWYGFKCVSSTTALVANCPDLPHDPRESESAATETVEHARALELLQRGGTGF